MGGLHQDNRVTVTTIKECTADLMAAPSAPNLRLGTGCVALQCKSDGTTAAVCTAPPNPETMTRLHPPESKANVEASSHAPTLFGTPLYRTNALLMAEEDSRCPEINCLDGRRVLTLNCPWNVARLVRAERRNDMTHATSANTANNLNQALLRRQII